LETLVLLILEQQVSIDSASYFWKLREKIKSSTLSRTFGFIGSGI
jgi:hypothetical protein